MGCSTIAMPLLSTLAALVIIVHSAEENYERQLHMMRPRALEAETNYEQPWRMLEMGPIMTESSHVTPSETWDEEDPEPSMRRRRVRKRKRRPQLIEEDDLIHQESVYTYGEEPQLQENIERPRRRRKKMDFQNNDKERQSSWNEEANRPKKRRGQKRKRPLGDSWPELSEFGGYREQIDSSEETVNKEIRNDNVHYDENDYQKNINEKSNMKVQIYNFTEIEGTTQAISNYGNQPQVVATDEDTSLSEFSIESVMEKENLNKTIIDTQEKIKDKGILSPNNNKPAKDKEPIDPVALKALLKKSNGKSLSEILQQNNLSLADLLHGRQKAISILNKESLFTTPNVGQFRHSKNNYYSPISSKENTELLNKSEKEENEHLEIETTTLATTTDRMIDRTDSTETNYKNEQEDLFKMNPHENETVENPRRGYLRRRFPGGIRRKLRTRPSENNTYKGQLSRDLIALTSMKYKNNRNISKSREWKGIIPSMMKAEPTKPNTIQIETETEMIPTTPCPFTETTTEVIYETTTDLSYSSMNTEPIAEARGRLENTAESKNTYLEIEGIDVAQFTSSPLEFNTEQEKEIITYKPRPLSSVKPSMNASDLRRQALNNRLKRKRVKHRTTTTEIPEELEIKDTFGNGKFVSASEFITKTQTRTTNSANEDDFMTLEDYLTTEATQHVAIRYRTKKPMKTKNITHTIQKALVTEDNAKFEIDEILNDNHTSAKLSKILKERNMTLKELVEHRERGSSHVHLADIFHNASREPNPPEPFLSKSLIEPISRETYPLRALLEANIYDPRTTTIDPSVLQINNANIPVVMDFGNNVNENGENKGILSLFDNYSKIDTADSNSSKDSAKIGKIKNVRTIYGTQEVETTREARMLNSEKDSVSWNDLINLMQKKHQKENKENDNSLASDIPISETQQKIDLEEDVDGDGVIVLDDLQRIRNIERKTSSDKLLELKLFERKHPPELSNESTVMLSDTKSVTVATASIIGLALILFLLTYAVLKWKQQNKIFHTKRAKEDEFVPSPVFESRKGHKINSSTRSKSPMLATSHIYSIDTLDTHAGSESPEYMWETLRKPFQ
ncbi:uncharacterized protein LOC120631508 [Pararge aegeria]|uniref:uncharacterized protein LOC120631508 n=1 Tax=Pararge aegeria TaxID=116150 RepID=UPI0019D2E125|nr:uncharacterized protein LOC120631508 [Pararge aegeria]